VKRTALLAVVGVVAALAAPVHASSDTSAPPRVAAAAWYLVGEDGRVLAKHNSRRVRAVASITKLMTALVALEHARPSDVVRVSPEAAGLGGSTIFLRAGEELTVAQLVRGMLIPSANDAAMALAIHVGGDSAARFVALMNEKAAELGLVDTTYVNPHGLDEPGHVSSARDATLLVKHALDVPIIRDALGRASFSLPGRQEFPTTDDLLVSWPPLVGGKTGHTAAAGWSEAAAASARGATVYGTVLGSDTRIGRNEALRTVLRFGLAEYRRIAAVDSSRVYAEAETGYGRPAVELVAPRNVVRIVHRTTSLVERVIVPTAVELPVRAGQRMGRVEVWDGSRLLASSELVAAEAVSEPGAFGKATWFVGRTGENLWELVT
jgi:D-alanyl-D-alanine carboxypeptidase (penicillin-binding protein 5/6)